MHVPRGGGGVKVLELTATCSAFFKIKQDKTPLFLPDKRDIASVNEVKPTQREQVA